MNFYHTLSSQFDSNTIRDLREWRLSILDGLLNSIFVIWIFALIGGINNVYELYFQKWPIAQSDLIVAVSLITIYLAVTALLITITFNRTLQYELRAGLFLFILYVLGIIGLIVAALSGDGRIFLFAFIIFSAIFFEFRHGVVALMLSLFTLIVVSWLQLSAVIVVPAENQINSTDMGAWLSGSTVLIGLSVAALISTSYLLHALGKSLGESRTSLKREQHLSRVLRTISDINQLIVREQDQGKLLSTACQKLVTGRGYAFAWIGLLEADGVTLKLAASAGETLDPELFTMNLNQPEAASYCAAIAIQSRTFVKVDTSVGNDPCLICPRRDKNPARSAISLPLLRDERIFGVLVVDHTFEAEIFDDEEIKLLQELADDLAYALENIEANTRLQTYARHQTLLNEITGAALETPDLETMLQRFIVGLEKILNADGYYITLWNEEKQQPVQFISSDEYEDILQTLPESIESGDKTFSQSILDNGHALAIEDIVNTPYISPHIAALFPVRSALGLPLIANSQKLGTLVLGFRETHQFTPDEIEVCDLISRQISLAILKARLDSVTHERAVELGRLYAAAQDMTSSIMDPPALLNKLAHHMVEALEATSGNIVSINSDNSVMQVVAEYWSDEALPGERQSDMGRLYLASDYSTILHAMFAGKTLTMHADTDNLTNIESEQFKEYDIRSMLFVPIMAHGKLFGNIEIWESRRKRDFTLAEIRLAQAMAGHAASIIENVQLIEILEKREAYFRALIDNSAEGVAILDAGGIIRYIAPSEERLTGYSPDEITGQSAFQYIHPQDLPVILKTFAEGVADQGAVRTVEYRLLRKDGVWRNFELTGHNMLDDQHIAGVVVNYRDITERKQAEQSLRESQIRLEAIISTAMNGIITIDSEYKVVLFNPSAERIFDCSASDVIGQSLKKIIPERYRHNHDNHIHDYSETGLSQRHKGLLDTLYGLRANGEEFPMEAFISQSEIDGQKFFTIIFQDITERKQVEDALKASETKFRTLAENIPSVVYLYKNDGDYTMLYLNDSIEALTGYPKTEFLENGLGFFDLYHPDDLPNIPSLRNVQTTHDNQGPFHITYRIRHKSGEWRWVDEWGSGVLDDFGKVQYLEGVMIDITERKRAEEDLRRHAMELETLVAASSALRTAQNVMEMVPILARQALRVVKGTYASIFLLDPESGEFISRGWYSVDAPFDVPLPNEANLRHFPDRGITGRIVATGDIYVTEDIQKDPVILILDGEQERLKDVHGGISLPLRTQEKIIGIMHIWSLNPRIFTETEIRLLIALAETASNAIHRAVLFEQTLQHASELALAYDNTLAGWARALELRDEITEGHTRRVTELTLSLARALGIPESEIIHIRRGALLHDIGKMGIPDSILHKPGAFTVQERIIMEQHTQYAYDMLSSIPFLQPALDIPFCHHEHWDGNGYPRKLKGEQIPLSARIFSIIDVWDALTSDRPYRPAWSKEKTRDYILERTDKQFDPRIVEAFFALDF